ncbi:hypothetical protein GQ457_03G024840 [Hibiscus cannabinus]
MNFLSSSLLILLLSSPFLHSAFPSSKSQGYGVDEAEVSSMGQDYQAVAFMGDGHDIQRKELHEVHSGPNPISNSVPQQRLKAKLRKLLP